MRPGKIESNLEQRKLLGIVTPNILFDVHAVMKGRSNYYDDCKFCGKSHDKGKCPAYGKTCNKCDSKNHFEAKCTQKIKKGRSNNPDKCKCCGQRTNSHNFPWGWLWMWRLTKYHGRLDWSSPISVLQVRYTVILLDRKISEFCEMYSYFYSQVKVNLCLGNGNAFSRFKTETPCMYYILYFLI